MGGPVVRHGRRNQSAEHARHRPMIKAATVLRWQGLNLRARDLEQAGRDSPGSWMARRQGYAQLWREGQSDGTLCQGSKAALQVRGVSGGPLARLPPCRHIFGRSHCFGNPS